MPMVPRRRSLRRYLFSSSNPANRESSTTTRSHVNLSNRFRSRRVLDKKLEDAFLVRFANAPLRNQPGHQASRRHIKSIVYRRAAFRCQTHFPHPTISPAIRALQLFGAAFLDWNFGAVTDRPVEGG